MAAVGWSQSEIEGGVDTQSFYKDPTTGEYSSQRQAVHANIISKMLEGAQPQPNPKLLLASGGAASGKTEAVERLKSDVPDCVYVNTDEIRALLPEFALVEGTDKAGLLHEEAGDIRDDLLTAALAQNMSILLDAPGSLSVAKLLDLCEQRGYFVGIAYTHRPVEECKAISAFRAANAPNPADRRIVPERVIEDSHKKARSGFNAMAILSLNREIWVYDKGNKQRGESADLIYYRSAHGRVGAFDRQRLETFVSCEPPEIDRDNLYPL